MLRACFCISFCALLFLRAQTQQFEGVYDHIRESQFDSAELLLDQMERSGKQLALKAYVSSRKGYNQKAILYYHEALEASSNVKLLYDCNKNLAATYQRMGLYSYALANYDVAEALLSDIVLTDSSFWQKEIFSLNHNKCMLYYRSSQLDLAIDYLNVAESLFRNEFDKQRSLNLLGIVYKQKQQFEKAISIYDDIINSEIDSKYKGLAHHNKAMALKELGRDPLPDLKEALKYLDGHERFVTLMDLGDLTGDLTLLDSALQYYPVEVDQEDYKVYRIIMRHHIESGNIAEAKKYDDLFHQENNKFIQMIQESKVLAQRYATENTLAQYSRQKELQKEIIRNVWVIVLLILVSILGLFFYFNLKKRKKDMVREVVDILQRKH